MTSGNDIVVSTADSITGEDIAAGGPLTLRGGNATTTSGGPVTITVGDAFCPGETGAAVTITSGDGVAAAADNAAGGDVNIRLGDFAQGPGPADTEEYGGYCNVICGLGKETGDTGDRDSALHIQGRPGTAAAAHIVTSQDTAPGIVAPQGGGVLTTGSTDVAGEVTGITNTVIGAVLTVTYQRPYPRVDGGLDNTFVVITPRNSAAAGASLYVSSATSTSFTVFSSFAVDDIDISYHVYGALA